jgi:hypothetical protein
MRGGFLVMVALSASVGLMGCTTTKSRTVDVSPTVNRNPTCANAVTVFEGRAQVPTSYYELAWVETEGNSVWTTDNQMLQKMKTQAAAVGANGLIANPVQANKTGVNVLGEAVGAHTATARASGLAIWMPGQADRTRLACGTR